MSNQARVGDLVDFLATLGGDGVDNGYWSDERTLISEDDEVVQLLVEGLWDPEDPDWRSDWFEELGAGLAPGGRVGSRVEPRESTLAGEGDKCAWYQSIPFHGLDVGIFIRRDCLYSIARELGPWMFSAGHSLSLRDTRRLILGAFTFLYLHEEFHHKVDSLALRVSIVEQRAVYKRYWNRVYAPAKGTDHLTEEALAGANAYRRLTDQPYRAALGAKAVSAIRAYLRAVFPFMPPGYRRAREFVRQDAYDEAEAGLTASVHEALQPPSSGWRRWHLATYMLRGIFPISSHMYAIVPRGHAIVLPHSPPSTVPSRTIGRLLRQHGYVRQPGRGKGSHEVWEKAGLPPIVLPHQVNVTPGVLRAIARSLGVKGNEALVRLARAT